MLNGTFETEAENGTVTPYNKQGITANYQSVETAGAFGGKAMRAVVTGDSDKVETVNAAETPVLSVMYSLTENKTNARERVSDEAKKNYQKYLRR